MEEKNILNSDMIANLRNNIEHHQIRLVEKRIGKELEYPVLSSRTMIDSMNANQLVKVLLFVKENENAELLGFEICGPAMMLKLGELVLGIELDGQAHS